MHAFNQNKLFDNKELHQNKIKRFSLDDIMIIIK